MIEHIKLKKHKGIDEVYLNGLKHINVICGRNSSGKSAVLEAMSIVDKYGLGYNLQFEPFFKDIIRRLVGYTPEYLGQFKNWLGIFLEDYKQDNPLSFSDETAELLENAKNSMNNYKGFRNYQTDNSNINIIGEAYNRIFKGLKEEYKPVLIPPKRILHSKTEIAPDESLEPNGKGCVNYLFYLKNQDRKSKEYEIYGRIYGTFKSITNQTFNITLASDRMLQLWFEYNGEWRPADDCGLGLRDVLSIVTFVLATDHSMYLIEEPENHLHADFQKKLVSKLLKQQTGKQFMLSTHAPIFLESTTADKIYFCQFSEGKVKVTDDTTLSKITNMLGYPVTEVLTSDALIFVEGPTDVPVYQAMLNWWGAMNKYNIRMWPLGGDIMAALDMSTFGNRKNVFAIIDSDPGSKKVRDTFIANCTDECIPVFQLERNAIENYFSISALKKVFSDQISDDVNKITFKRPVDQQLGFSKEKTLKTKNAEVVAEMSLDDIAGTDLEEILSTIIEKIEHAQPKAESMDNS